MIYFFISDQDIKFVSISLTVLVFHGTVQSLPTTSQVSLSQRLRHPCYDQSIIEYDYDENEEVLTLSKTDILNQVQIPINEAERSADRFISKTVTEACLNVSFRFLLSRSRFQQHHPVSSLLYIALASWNSMTKYKLTYWSSNLNIIFAI